MLYFPYMKSFKDFEREALRDPETRREYDRSEPEFRLICKMIEMRINGKLTQKKLAEKMGTKQSAISRFESGTYNPSLAFLHKLADALDVKLHVTVR